MQNTYLQYFHDVMPMGRPAWLRPVTVRFIYNVFVFSIYLVFVYFYCCTYMNGADVVTCYTKWRMLTSDHSGEIRLFVHSRQSIITAYFSTIIINL